MKTSRIRPFVLTASLAAAVAVIGADTTKKPAPKTQPAPAAAKPADAAPAAPGAPAAAKPQADEVLATVNGEAIKNSDVDAALARRGVPAGALPPEQKLEFTRQAVDNLVIQKLLDKASAGVKVEEQEVDKELAKIRERENISDEQMNLQLAQMGITLDQLKKDIRTGMQQQRWIDGQIKGKYTEPTEAEAKDFYDKHPEHFQASVRASHILIRVEKDAKPADVEAGKKKAQAALERVKKEDFAKVATEVSEDPSAKQNQGDLNFFTKDRMVPEFSTAAFAMKKGDVSAEPVRSDFGFHVIKVTDRKEQEEFAAAKPKITEHLAGQRKQPLAKTVVDEMRANAKVDIKLPPPPPPADIQNLVPNPGGKAPAPTPNAKPGEKRKPIEAVTPPVSVPPAEPKKAEPKKK
jgi:peptidyl-prolyl cis-trans isomerase C